MQDADDLFRANGRGRPGGQTAEGDSKAFPRLKQPLFAVPALRELESACGVRLLLWDAATVPTGFSEGRRGGGGQQQFATQTLRVHLLGLEMRAVHKWKVGQKNTRLGAVLAACCGTVDNEPHKPPASGGQMGGGIPCLEFLA